MTTSLVLALAGCGPLIDPELTSESSDSSSASPNDEGSTTVSDEGSTTFVFDEGSTTEVMPPDMGDPGPSLCPAGAGDLSLEWTVTEPDEGRADAVAVGAGLVAWATGEFSDSELRVLDYDGNPRWNQPVPLLGGEGELSFQDLEVDPAGTVILAGTISGDDGLDGLFRWYDGSGNVLAEDVFATPEFDWWHGVARLPSGDMVAAGQSDDEMFVRRYTPAAEEVWSQAFSEAGWSSHVAVAPDGTILVSGHPPTLVAYDVDGTLLWSHFGEDTTELEVASSVIADGQGRAWMTVISEGNENRVERFDVTGAMDLTLPLDFRPNAIATDLDDSIVVAGAIIESSTIVVERRAAGGALLARYERPGRFATGVAVDEDCHAYVSGYTNFEGAWLEKLR